MLLSDFILRICFAILFGFLIGLERQLTGHIAGIQINVLVCLGTSVFVLFSIVMEAPDTTRIAAQIVTGVGFLCSGIIFKDGSNVRGLSTAATIWCTAAIGVLNSSGKAEYAACATGLLLLSNVLFKAASERIRPLDSFNDEENTYKLTVLCPESSEFEVRTVLMKPRASRLSLIQLESQDLPKKQVEIEAVYICMGKRLDGEVEKILRKSSNIKGVVSAGWEII